MEQGQEDPVVEQVPDTEQVQGGMESGRPPEEETRTAGINDLPPAPSEAAEDAQTEIETPSEPAVPEGAEKGAECEVSMDVLEVPVIQVGDGSEEEEEKREMEGSEPSAEEVATEEKVRWWSHPHTLTSSHRHTAPSRAQIAPEAKTPPRSPSPTPRDASLTESSVTR